MQPQKRGTASGPLSLRRRSPHLFKRVPRRASPPCRETVLHHHSTSFPSTTMPSPPLFTLVAPRQTHPPSQTPSRRFAHRRHHHRRCRRHARPPRARSCHVARARHHATSPILAFPYWTSSARVKHPPLPSVLRHARDSSAVTFSMRRLELGTPTSLPAHAPYCSGRTKDRLGTLLTVNSLTRPSHSLSSRRSSSFQLVPSYSPIPLAPVVRVPNVARVSSYIFSLLTSTLPRGSCRRQGRSANLSPFV
jgi:hypothetical protein